ncbi:MAG: iron chelate uptake ABC transporter family permease subunit, partial [Acidipropionibacterium acidipropionici]|nr:iron chelate uptake ABC transporter family permease subunit [Acidipropionibacterium acidipropionici]
MSTSVDGSLLLRLGPVCLRTSARRIWLAAGLAVAVVVIGLAALDTGTMSFGVGEILGALTGHGSYRVERVILGIRAPRLLAGMAVGACLALSGAVFQNLTGNPLGSPDVIGFVTGAATGAVIAIIGFSAGAVVVAACAVGSGLLTAVAV